MWRKPLSRSPLILQPHGRAKGVSQHSRVRKWQKEGSCSREANLTDPARGCISCCPSPAPGTHSRTIPAPHHRSCCTHSAYRETGCNMQTAAVCGYDSDGQGVRTDKNTPEGTIPRHQQGNNSTSSSTVGKQQSMQQRRAPAVPSAMWRSSSISHTVQSRLFCVENSL